MVEVTFTALGRGGETIETHTLTGVTAEYLTVGDIMRSAEFQGFRARHPDADYPFMGIETPSLLIRINREDV